MVQTPNHSRMMVFAFITFNSSLVPLIEGLCNSNPWEFELSRHNPNFGRDKFSRVWRQFWNSGKIEVSPGITVRMGSSWLRMARGGFGAKAPPLATWLGFTVPRSDQLSHACTWCHQVPQHESSLYAAYQSVYCKKKFTCEWDRKTQFRNEDHNASCLFVYSVDKQFLCTDFSPVCTLGRRCFPKQWLLIAQAVWYESWFTYKPSLGQTASANPMLIKTLHNSP